MAKSVYKRISKNLSNEGKLPEGFSLWGLEASEDPFAADGAADAAWQHSESRTPLEPEAFYEAFTLLAERNFAEAFGRFSELFTGCSFQRALPYLYKELGILKNEDNPYPVLNEWIRLLRESPDPSLVKLSLLALEAFSLENLPEVKNVIKVLARSDELAFYAALSMRHWPEGKYCIWEAAKNLRGWGRVMLIPELDFSDPEVNKWLLEEGQYNTAEENYTAAVILLRSEIPEMTAAGLLDSSQFHKLSRLLLNGLRSGPGLHAPGNADVSRFMDLAENWFKLACLYDMGAAECEVVLRLHDYLQYLLPETESGSGARALSPAQQGSAGQDNPEKLRKLRERMQILASRLSGMMDPSFFSDAILEERGEAGLILLQDLMGMPANPEDALELLKFDSLGNLELMEFLTQYPETYKSMLDYYSSLLPLNEMAAGPLARRSSKTLSDEERILSALLRAMRRRPWQGREFIVCGLQSPRSCCRLSALLTLKFWLAHGVMPLKVRDSELFSLLCILERYERNPLIFVHIHEISRMHVRRSY